MSIGLLSLAVAAACGVVSLILAPKQEEKPHRLCGTHRASAFENTAPTEIIF